MAVRGVDEQAEPPRETIGTLLSWAVRALTTAMDGGSAGNAGAVSGRPTDTPLLDAELLLAFITGRPRSSVLAFPERSVRTAQADEFERLVARRVRGEPLAYLVRAQEFFSLPLRVTSAVLIPRPETELLVEEALAHLPLGMKRAVLDLATGSGAIALALKSQRPDLDVTASDVSAAALIVARANAERLGLAVQFVESDWFAVLGGRRFDLVVCNPPYVASGDRAFAGLGYEPRLALDGGGDGLDALRTVLAGAAAHLTADGVLLLEHGHDQRPELLDLAAASGWEALAVHDDLAGQARVVALRAVAPR